MQNKKYHLRRAAVLLFALLLTAKVSAQTEQNYQQSINDISKKINNLSRNLNANKSKLEREQTSLLEAEQALADINRKLSEAQAERKSFLAAIEDIQQKQRDLSRKQDDSRSALKNLIASHHKNGLPSQLKLVLNQENPYAVGRLNHYQSYFSTAIMDRFKRLNDQLLASKKLSDDYTIKVAQLQNIQQEQEFLKKDQQQKKQQREQNIARLDAKVSAVEDKLKQLTADRNRLNVLLKQLEQQKAELARIERERREAQRLAEKEALKKGTPAPKPIRKLVKGGFLQQKGRLTCPVSSNAVTRFGQRMVSSGMKSEGIFYDTKTSTDVQSIFRGQVLFSDFLKGFGLLLIIDHGDDHISLYGHNDVLYKKVGDSVDTGEIVSKTGKTGGLKSHGLYFEIRNNTTPINPSDWCQ